MLPLLGLSSPPLKNDEDDTDLLMKNQMKCLQDELKQLCIHIERRYLDPSNSESLSKKQLEADKHKPEYLSEMQLEPKQKRETAKENEIRSKDVVTPIGGDLSTKDQRA